MSLKLEAFYRILFVFRYPYRFVYNNNVEGVYVKGGNMFCMIYTYFFYSDYPDNYENGKDFIVVLFRATAQVGYVLGYITFSVT